jgi:preprotein translocase SecE subunit
MKLKNIWLELKKTNWPSKKQLAQLTVYTLVLCGIIAMLMVGLDLLFFNIRDWFLNLLINITKEKTKKQVKEKKTQEVLLKLLKRKLLKRKRATLMLNGMS